MLNRIYNYYVIVKTKQNGGNFMTDERFVYEIIRDLREDLKKTEEQKGEKVNTLTVKCVLKRTYRRIVRLQDQINKKSRNFSIELIGDKQVKIIKKS